MESVQQAMMAVRQVESANDYARQQRVTVGGLPDTKVGAYGILNSRWAQMAEELGYSGADWRDPKAQDVLAKEKLERDYKELGSWEMAAVAFRYGTMAARKLVQTGYIEPKAIEDAGLPRMSQYLRSLRTGAPQVDMSVEGKLPTANNGMSSQQATPQNKRAEDIVRQQLRSMLNAQQKATPAPEESVSEIPDVPAQEEVSVDG